MVVKKKDETAGIPIKEFIRLKLQISLFLIDDSSEFKKVRSVHRNLAEKITHNEHKDVSLNQKCLRHLMNRNQS